jgi:pyruvate,water dikinase
VRRLGIYYNDAVRPADPYEFVELLRGEQMVASRRNQALRELAKRVRGDQALRQQLSRAVAGGWSDVLPALQALPGGRSFVHDFQNLVEFMDVAYGGERLADRPDLLLQTLLEMANTPEISQSRAEVGTVQALEQRLVQAVGPEREKEVREVLRIGRLSWRLRDDDNLLVGRLESQLLRTLELAVDRLLRAGRLEVGGQVHIAAAQALADGLRDPSRTPVIVPKPRAETPTTRSAIGESPRQLVGQPAAPGLATGKVRRVRGSQDLGRFRAGEVLVCDAIQPTMTHLVPLACAIVERRGGMLIHGAIIARELGIPCVNGIPNAVDLLEEGQIVTVDGYLGIVTVGVPEFDLEKG